MNETRRSEIESYISHFRSQYQKISRVQEPLYRKILAVTLISTLAEGRYSSLRRDRQKFVALIENDSGWAHSKAVNILHLKQVVDKRRDLSLSEGFVQSVNEVCADVHRAAHKTIDLASDPLPAALLASANRREHNLIEDAKHSSLLYLYRCKLVHEFREQGYPWEFEEDDTPIYRFSELVYPANWVVGLLPPMIASLEKYYTCTGKDPRAAHTFGSPWT